MAGIAPPSPQPGSGLPPTPPGADPGVAQLPQFASDVAKATGLDPRVVWTWAQSEGAYASGGTGHFNYLNLRPEAGDVYAGISPGRFEEFSSEQQAVVASVRRIREPFLWTSPALGGPGLGAVVAKGGSPAQEFGAIGRSNWDSDPNEPGGGHYRGSASAAPGTKLLELFEGSFGVKAAGAPPKSAGTPPAPVGAAGGPTKSAVGSAVSGIGDVIDSFDKFFKFVTSYRFLEILGGFVLLGLGLVILARAIGSGAKSSAAGQQLAQGAGDLAAVATLGYSKRASASRKAARQTRSAYRQGQQQGNVAEARRQGRRSVPREVSQRQNVVSMGERPSQRARVREAAARSQGPGELPADY